MRRLVSCHHLTCVGKDGGCEEAKGVDTCVKKRGQSEREGCICKLKITESIRLVRVRNNHLNGNQTVKLTIICVGGKGQTGIGFMALAIAFMLYIYGQSL